MGLLGCGVTEEMCTEDVELCAEECVLDEQGNACIQRCEEIYEACLESVEESEDDAEAVGSFFELLCILFDDDYDYDEDDC